MLRNCSQLLVAELARYMFTVVSFCVGGFSEVHTVVPVQSVPRSSGSRGGADIFGPNIAQCVPLNL